jgi:hypothetical protein
MERTPRDENALFTQLVADTNLTMSRIVCGIGNNSLLGWFVNTVLVVGFTPVLLYQGRYATFFNGIFIPVKCIS